jgi:hypothetical protein
MSRPPMRGMTPGARAGNDADDRQAIQYEECAQGDKNSGPEEGIKAPSRTSKASQGNTSSDAMAGARMARFASSMVDASCDRRGVSAKGPASVGMVDLDGLIATEGGREDSP